MFVEVLGDPWVSPERYKCCSFVGFRLLSDMSYFLCVFIYIYIYLQARSFCIKKDKPYMFHIDSGRSTCCYFVVFLSMILAGAFSMNSFEDSDGKIMCIGGAQDLKTLEILMRKREFLFSLFYR